MNDEGMLLGGIEPANVLDAAIAFDRMLRVVHISTADGLRFEVELPDRSAPDPETFRLLARMSISRYGDKARWSGLLRSRLVAACHIDTSDWSAPARWQALRRLVTIGTIGQDQIRSPLIEVPRRAEVRWPVISLMASNSATAFANIEQISRVPPSAVGSIVFDDAFMAWRLLDDRKLQRAGGEGPQRGLFRQSAEQFLLATRPRFRLGEVPLSDRSLHCEVLARAHIARI